MSIVLEAEVAGGTRSEDEAVIDGKIITAQTWLSHSDFYRLISRTCRYSLRLFSLFWRLVRLFSDPNGKPSSEGPLIARILARFEESSG